jgi:hypothetical protein
MSDNRWMSLVSLLAGAILAVASFALLCLFWSST